MVGIALYGKNGHQISATAKLRGARICGSYQFKEPGIKQYQTERELIEDADVTLVSVCDAIRAEQGKTIYRLLDEGKDVYAEKPLAMSAQEVEKLYTFARERGRFLGEMSDTVFQEPYLKMRSLIAEGVIGRVIQVHVQKSYPYRDWRPQNEDVDGGLIRQCAIHAVRIIEQGVGLKIERWRGFETSLGNPVKGGGLQMAASLLFYTNSGAVCSVDANYLNPDGNHFWSHEYVNVFGESGTIEADVERCALTLVDHYEKKFLQCAPSEKTFYLQKVINYLNGEGDRPLTVQQEIRPAIIVSKLKDEAERESF